MPGWERESVSERWRVAEIAGCIAARGAGCIRRTLDQVPEAGARFTNLPDARGVRKAALQHALRHQQLPTRLLRQPRGGVVHFGIALAEAPVPEIHRGPREMPQEM